MIRLFRVSIPAGVLVLLLSEIILVSLCFLLGIFVRTDLILYLSDGGLLPTILVVGSIILGLHLSDLYTKIHVKSGAILAQDLSQVIGGALLAQGLISYADPSLRFGRGAMLVGTIFSYFALFFWRIFYDRFIIDVVAGDRILFIGTNHVVEEIAQHIAAHRELGLS